MAAKPGETEEIRQDEEVEKATGCTPLELIETARDAYASEGEIEIDDTAEFSIPGERDADGKVKGVWVQAWVYVAVDGEES